MRLWDGLMMVKNRKKCTMTLVVFSLNVAFFLGSSLRKPIHFRLSTPADNYLLCWLQREFYPKISWDTTLTPFCLLQFCFFFWMLRSSSQVLFFSFASHLIPWQAILRGTGAWRMEVRKGSAGLRCEEKIPNEIWFWNRRDRHDFSVWIHPTCSIFSTSVLRKMHWLIGAWLTRFGHTIHLWSILGHLWGHLCVKMMALMTSP